MAVSNPNLEQRDSSWVRQVMFLPNRGGSATSFNENRSAHVLRSRDFSEGVLNFADTTLGGNKSINPRPQFTEYADQNIESLLATVSGRSELGMMGGEGITSKSPGGANITSGGMGRRYFEMFDNHANRIYMDFGIPMYNSLGNFFSRFYDHDMGLLANQGIMIGLGYTAGKFLGFMFLWPVIAIMKIVHVVQDITRYLRHIPSSRYYYMKPTMHVYWTMVTTISTALMVNMGLIPGYDPMDLQDEKTLKLDAVSGEKSVGARSAGISDEEFAAYQRILPDIFRLRNGGIDARAVATRYQRLANAHRKEFDDITANTNSIQESYAAVLEYIKNNRSRDWSSLDTDNQRDYIDEYKKSQVGTTVVGKDISIPTQDADTQKQIYNSILDANNATEVVEGAEDNINRSLDKVKELVGIQSTASAQAVPIPLAEQNNAEAIATTNALDAESNLDLAHKSEGENPNEAGSSTGFWDGLGDFMEENHDFYLGTVRDGMAWVSFIVDHHNNYSESFSNTTRQSSIADSMNQTSSESRNMVFNLAGGNIGDNLAADVFESFMGGVKNVFQGVMNSVGLQGLNALGGAAFPDIPEFWDASSVSLPTNSYNIQLRSPYGNPMSLFINVYFPLAMLLAGVAPRSTGEASYTSPFLCRLWHKGRSQIQLGMITDLTVSRGQGNIGWNTRDQATGIDVSFTISNLSKMLHMPITPEVGLKDAFGLNLFNEETNFTDYMNVLAGMGLPEQFYRKSNIIKQWHLSRANWTSWSTMSNFNANFVHGTLPGNLLNAVSKDRQFY